MFVRVISWIVGSFKTLLKKQEVRPLYYRFRRFKINRKQRPPAARITRRVRTKVAGGLERSEDHRKAVCFYIAPRRGASVLLAPFSGALLLLLSPSGLRLASATGYYLTAFQADTLALQLAGFCPLDSSIRQRPALLNVEVLNFL